MTNEAIRINDDTELGTDNNDQKNLAPVNPGSLNDFAEGKTFADEEAKKAEYFRALCAYRGALAVMHGVDLEDLHRYKGVNRDFH